MVSANAFNWAFCSSLRISTSVPHASAGTAIPTCSDMTSAFINESNSVSFARQLAVAAFPPAPQMATRLPVTSKTPSNSHY